MPAPANSFLTIGQVAQALNISTKTVRRLIKSNELHHHRFGSVGKPLVRIAHDDLRTFMAAARE